MFFLRENSHLPLDKTVNTHNVLPEIVQRAVCEANHPSITEAYLKIYFSHTFLVSVLQEAFQNDQSNQF